MDSPLDFGYNIIFKDYKKETRLATDTKILKIISNNTKKAIDPSDIVTPTLYASLFAQSALEEDVTIEDEPALAYDILASECTHLSQMQEQISHSADQLSESTSKAISAIQTQDEALLNEVLTETNDLRAEIEKLKEAVYKDELTRSYNRKWLHDTLLQEDENSFNKSGILIIIDLNYFKQVNDTYGHILGDKVLVFVANELKKSRQDVVRYGGDEFLVLFDESSTLKRALCLLQKIREDILTKKLKAGENTFRVSFSIGGVAYNKGDSLSEVIAEADQKMYLDKQAIKKRVTGI